MPADPYIVLGVLRSASLDEVKAAYRKRAAETHPDRNPGNPHAAQRFRAATAAWEQIQAERGTKSAPRYEAPAPESPPPPPPAGSAKERFYQHVVATGVVGTEAAVTEAAERLIERGGWRSVVGQALKGAAAGLSEGARKVTSASGGAPPADGKNRG